MKPWGLSSIDGKVQTVEWTTGMELDWTTGMVQINSYVGVK